MMEPGEGKEDTSSSPSKESESDWTPDSIYILRNQLPRRIRIEGDDGHRLLLAPFEQREVPGKSLHYFYKTSLDRRGDDLIVAEKTAGEQRLESLLGGGFWVFILYLMIGFQLEHVAFWAGIPVLGALVLVVIWVTQRRGGLEVARWIKQVLSLIIVVLTAVGIPAATIWYGTGLDDVAQTAGSPVELFETSPEALGRSLQLLFMSAASLLPALMYFLFDREQLGTLRDRFLQQVFRLDPSIERLNDLRAKYGSQIDEVYGTAEASRARLLGGRLSPIIVATLLITLGWTLTLFDPDLRLSGDGGGTFLDLFVPQRSVVTFGFLGAYFFGIQLVLRSYMRGDLRAKSYSHISVRIFIVVILAWILQEVVGSGNTGLLVLVFLAGIVPETALSWIREFPRRFGWSIKSSSGLEELTPLTMLEGIDLYDRTRLMDEGVTNVEALAHHDFVELMLRTRIPAARLVDWLDQAILYLHTRSRPQTEELDSNGHKADEQGGGEPWGRDVWASLHGYGIRTASDLLLASDLLVASDSNAKTLEKTTRGESSPESSGEDGSQARYSSLREDECNRADRLGVILATMADDEWLQHVLHWRAPLDLSTTCLDLDAHYPESLKGKGT
ncbi:MAG: hypothetical protein M3124_08450 [Actinomycetota bacterium]|nr:hypothetical protein [Actinomycetota bacterium]